MSDSVKKVIGYVALPLGLIAAILVLVNLRNGPLGGRAVAAPPLKFGPDSLGYSALFDHEIKAIGQITPVEFAARYPAPNYLGQLTWDPTTAKFFDELNAAEPPKQKPAPQRVYKLTDEELALYRQNGFVVSERLGGYSFGQVFHEVYTRDLPVYISSDAILHAWHRSFSAMLQELELTYLMPTLTAILDGMRSQLNDANAKYGQGVLKDSVLDADYFLTVAVSLLKNSVQISQFGQDERVQDTLNAIQQERIQTFVLFGREREMDFSQFKPRGHYEQIIALRKYFQAMMWCGRTDMRIAGGFDKKGELSSPRELGSAVVLVDLLKRSGQMDSWRKFDKLIQVFVGRNDSASFDDLDKLAGKLGIESPAVLNTEESLKKFQDDVLSGKLGMQDIRGDVYDSPIPSTVKVALPRSFTVLGQKFVVDSWVTSKVVSDDIIWDNEKVDRRIPSALDVAFAALGNDHVVPTIAYRMTAGPRRFRDGLNYQHNLTAVRNVIDQQAKNRSGTIYDCWLDSLRTLSAPNVDSKYPEAMRTNAWAMKQTNTQLASWTQLRHDTILYVKQSYSARFSCYYPDGFVEPVIPFWEKMEVMAKRSAQLIAEADFPVYFKANKDRMLLFFQSFADRMAKLKTVAEKQLAQKELTADEKKVLADVMQLEHKEIGSGAEPTYTGWYPKLFYRTLEDCVKWDALATDMHTNPESRNDPGCVLHQGVGNVDLMIIAIDNGKDRVVYAGPTMSHYEFEMPHAKRKANSEWKADLLNAKVPPRPDWTKSYLVPHRDQKPVTQEEKNRLKLVE